MLRFTVALLGLMSGSTVVAEPVITSSTMYESDPAQRMQRNIDMLNRAIAKGNVAWQQNRHDLDALESSYVIVSSRPMTYEMADALFEMHELENTSDESNDTAE